MKISLKWLKELVEYNLSAKELAEQLSLKSIGVKSVTDDFIELDLTYNRGDLLSLRGIAVEVSAITNSNIKFSLEHPKNFPWDNIQDKVNVKVEDEKLCPIYCIAKIEGLKVEHSNETWVKKLSDCGIRSINNIADITNLVMIEYGQPMHSFDADKVRGCVRVRVAKENEKHKTLDGKERILSREDLVIADEEKVIGLAGVMGGENTEISSSTSNLLLEAAIFDPSVNRTTSKRHGLYSDASKRFQHGLNKITLIQAFVKAIKMYEQLGGKLTGIALVGDLNEPKKNVLLNQINLENLLGINVDSKYIEDLKKLQFNPVNTGNGNWEVEPNYQRLDIKIEEDLIEEVARIYGYEKIKDKPLIQKTIPPLDQSLPNFIYNLKQKLKEIGLTEVQTYSFYSSTVLQGLKSPKLDINDLIKIANPISTETEYLRMDIWPNLVEVIGKNIKKGYKDIGIFEIGKIYFRDDEKKPSEKYTLSIALMNNSDNPIEELITLIQKLNLDIKITQPKETSTLFHPKRIVDIFKDNKRIGGAGEIHLRLLNKLGIEKRVAVLEINLDKII